LKGKKYNKKERKKLLIKIANKTTIKNVLKRLSKT